MNLTGADSYWKGNTLVSWNGNPTSSDLEVKDMTLNMEDGAQWTPSYVENTDSQTYVALNYLNFNDSVINIENGSKQEVVVHVTEVKEEVKKEVTVIDKSQTSKTTKEKNKTEEKTTTKKTEQTKKEENIIKEEIEKYTVLESFKGKLAAYGPDCKGCSNRTSSGFDISKTIYYNDPEYGQLRILAGDKKYPYGTVVNLKIDSTTTIKGIVLDRGGDIGIGKKFQFDLLFSSQKEAASFGSKNNVTFEILRLGY